MTTIPCSNFQCSKPVGLFSGRILAVEMPEGYLCHSCARREIIRLRLQVNPHQPTPLDTLILDFLKTNFNSSHWASQIAAAIGKSQAECTSALRKLCSVGLVRKNEGGMSPAYCIEQI